MSDDPNNDRADDRNNTDATIDPDEDINYNPLKRWKERAERLSRAVKQIEQWIAHPLPDKPRTLKPVLDEFDRCLFNHKCTCTMATSEDDVCDLFQPLRDYRSASHGLLKLLERLVADDMARASMVVEMEEDEKDKRIRQLEREALEKDLLTSAEKVASNCDRVFRCLREIFSHLLHLSQLGNKTPTYSNKVSNQVSNQGSRGSRERSSTENTPGNSSKRRKSQGPIAALSTPVKVAQQDEIDYLEPFATRDPTPVSATLHDSNIAADDIVKLNKFHSFLDKGFKNKVIGEDEVKFQETVLSVMTWPERTDRELIAGTGDTDGVGFYLLSLTANELQVSHKMLYAIMVTIASILKADTFITHEQHSKVDFSQDQEIQKYVDFMIGRVCQHLKVLRVFMVDTPIEIKALRKKGASLKSLRPKGLNQVIGHLAKSLMHAFCFGGIGTDSTVRGAVVTLISVEILELELKNVGTGRAVLLVRSSGNWPLLDEGATIGLLDSELKTSTFESIFPQCRDPAQGFNLLSGLILSNPGLAFSNCDAVYSDTADSPSGEALGNLLGSGTYSNVYKLKDGVFIKVPKNLSFVKDLEDEMEILKRFSDDRIPKAGTEKLGFLRVHVRCEISTLQCLKLTGVVGESASKFAFISIEQVKRVCLEVGKALDHAHGLGVAHLDVRPSNIVLSVGEDKFKVQLIDWGLAADFNRKVSGFRGCLPYAHDDLLAKDLKVDKTKEENKLQRSEVAENDTFAESSLESHMMETKAEGKTDADGESKDEGKTDDNGESKDEGKSKAKDAAVKKTTWSPSPEHDFASLAYTITTVMFRLQQKKSSSFPWHGFFEVGVEVHALESRRNLVRTCLEVLDEDVGVYLHLMRESAGIHVPAQTAV